MLGSVPVFTVSGYVKTFLLKIAPAESNADESCELEQKQ